MNYVEMLTQLYYFVIVVVAVAASVAVYKYVLERRDRYDFWRDLCDQDDERRTQ